MIGCGRPSVPGKYDFPRDNIPTDIDTNPLPLDRNALLTFSNHYTDSLISNGYNFTEDILITLPKIIYPDRESSQEYIVHIGQIQCSYTRFDRSNLFFTRYCPENILLKKGDVIFINNISFGSILTIEVEISTP